LGGSALEQVIEHANDDEAVTVTMDLEATADPAVFVLDVTDVRDAFPSPFE
jgi:hypothetical protein